MRSMIGLDFLLQQETLRIKWSPLRTAIALGVLVLFACLAYSRWIWQDSVVPWDSKYHFYPMYSFLGETFLRNELPTWNPYHFSGYPAVSDPQSLFFTPTMLGFAYFFPKASMHAFDAMIFAHLLLGGAGVVFLFRRRSWHELGAIMAGMIFILGGSAAARLQHTGMIISYGFLPFSLYFLEEALERKSYVYSVTFAIFASLMAIGRDQVAFLGCFFLIYAFVWTIVSQPHPWQFFRARILLVLLMAVTALVCLGVPVLLTLQFLSFSNRPGISFGIAIAGSLAPMNFATLLVPNIFGSLNWIYDYWGPGEDAMSTFDWTDRSIDYLFIGTLPFFFLFWHGWVRGRLFDKKFQFFLIPTLFFICYAIGHNAFVFGWIFDWIPGVNLYRRPADATFLLNFCFAMASGYVLDQWLFSPISSFFSTRWRNRVWIAFNFLGAATIIVSALALSTMSERVWSATWELFYALVLLGMISALLYYKRPTPLVAGLLVFGTGGELIWRNAASALNAEPLSNYAIYDQLPDSQLAAFNFLKRELRARAELGDHPRIEMLGENGLWQNIPITLGIESTLGYNPLRIADYERVVGSSQNATDPFQRQYPDTFRGYRSRLASLLGIEYLVFDRPLEQLPNHIPRPKATLVYAGDQIYIYKLQKAAPRTYLATSLKYVHRDQILANAKEFPAFDPLLGQAVMDLKDAILIKGKYPESHTPPADVATKILTYRDHIVEIEVSTSEPGILVLHDIWYPGWFVQVDGAPASLLRVNILFRGVEVPPGTHRVTFTFEPLSLQNLVEAASVLTHK